MIIKLLAIYDSNHFLSGFITTLYFSMIIKKLFNKKLSNGTVA